MLLSSIDICSVQTIIRELIRRAQRFIVSVKSIPDFTLVALVSVSVKPDSWYGF